MNLIFHEQHLLLVRTDVDWHLPTAEHISSLDFQLSKITVTGITLVAQLFNADKVANI